MGRRKIQFQNEMFYHVTSKSIDSKVIFNDPNDFLKMKSLMHYYNHTQIPIGFSHFLEFKNRKTEAPFDKKIFSSPKLLSIASYCLMNTHIHFILQQKQEKGISNFCRKVLLSYACHFNKKHKRKGPLWQGKFTAVPLETTSQLFNCIAYIHLNPVTSYIVENPLDWEHSSHKEYITGIKKNVNQIIKIPDYKEFATSLIPYFREKALSRKNEF